MSKLPKLFGADKKGGYKVWDVYSLGDTVFVTHGKLDGKQQTRETICKGKNLGRSNETTPEVQAWNEAQSKWKKQVDKYYRETLKAVDELSTEGVMLAQDYTKKPHYLEEEFQISPKLDGLRVKTVFEDGEPVWKSRGDKIYPVPKHLVEELKAINKAGFSSIDGEAYIHGVKLQKIQSCVKKTNDLTSEVTYQVFDLPSPHKWSDRLLQLQSLKSLTDSLKMVNVVEQEYCTKSGLDKKLQSYLDDGYEGAMMRNLNGLYAFQNKRSNDLLKYKLFKDSEAKVIGCRIDKNKEGVLLCEWQGVQVEMKMKGDHAFRCYESQKKLIGSFINFTYQDLSEDGVPSFAVGQYVRDCDEEGNPLN